MRRSIKKFGNVVRALFLVACLLFAFSGSHPPATAQSESSADALRDQRLAQIDEHLRNSDRNITDNSTAMRENEIRFRGLEATVNQWKGAESVWFKIISILGASGVALQVSGRFSIGKKRRTEDDDDEG